MKKMLRALIGALLIASFIYMGHFFDQECQHKYPDGLPVYMYEIYDIVYDIDVKIVKEIYTDIWQDPKTTEEKGGDCEDYAILVTRKLWDLGYQVEPVGACMNYLGTSGKHMWTRVYIPISCGGRYEVWDIDLTQDKRIFAARMPYELTKKEETRFWDKVTEE